MVEGRHFGAGVIGDENLVVAEGVDLQLVSPESPGAAGHHASGDHAVDFGNRIAWLDLEFKVDADGSGGTNPAGPADGGHSPRSAFSSGWSSSSMSWLLPNARASMSFSVMGGCDHFGAWL